MVHNQTLLMGVPHWGFPRRKLPTVPSLRFRLFGKFTAHHDAGLLKGIEASKDQELLSYLLIHRDRPHSREALASLLWGDTSTEKSKKYLRQALWHLHAALNSDNELHTD